jgi:AraC-like DNA-binding protein
VLAVLNIVGAAESVLLGCALMSSRGNQLANRLLGALAFVVAIFIVAAVLVSTRYLLVWPHFSFVHDPFVFCTAPLLFLYVRTLMRPEQRLQRLDFFHFLPAIVSALYLAPFYALTSAEKLQYLLGTLGPGHTGWFYVRSLLLLAQGVGYAILIAVMVVRHSRKAEQKGSVAAFVGRNGRSVLVVLLTFCVIGALRMTNYFEFFARFHLQENLILPLAASILVFIVGFNALRASNWFVPPVGLGRKYEKSTLTPDLADIYLLRLRSRMIADKPYLDGALTLQKLAQTIGISPNHLSQAINENLNQSFLDFVNSYRVDEAKRRLLDPAFGHYSILAIAEEVGFNSKSAFNTAFKKFAGKTPSEFRKDPSAAAAAGHPVLD